MDMDSKNLVLHEYVSKAVQVSWAPQPAAHGGDLLDQQGPQGLAKDSVNRLVSLGEAFEGVRVQGEERFLQ